MSDDTVHAANSVEEREALGFKKWPDSGVQTYRVGYRTDSGGLGHVDVEAATGNEAAEKALMELGGGRVTNIHPAPQKRKLSVKPE